MMETWLPIRYRGYWDIPRMILVRYANRLFMFDCPFDHDLDDYREHFTVYLLPNIPDEDTPDDWTTLLPRATRLVGTVSAADVKFDPTRRAAIDAEVFDLILPSTPAPQSAPNARADSPAPVS